MKFKVGEKVRIRSWEDMKKEFGLNGRGDIKCEKIFVSDMKDLCGKIFTISDIKGPSVYFKEDDTTWVFSTDMIEPVTLENSQPLYEIHILSDGVKTKATYVEQGEVKQTAETRKHPDDKFDMKVGAETVLQRLFEKKMPYLCCEKEFYGTVGTATNYKDKYGRDLFVGDIVKIKSKKTSYTNEQYVVLNNGKTFIMGIKDTCDDKTGIISDWEIELICPYNQIKKEKRLDFVTIKFE